MLMHGLSGENIDASNVQHDCSACLVVATRLSARPTDHAIPAMELGKSMKEAHMANIAVPPCHHASAALARGDRQCTADTSLGLDQIATERTSSHSPSPLRYQPPSQTRSLENRLIHSRVREGRTRTG